MARPLVVVALFLRALAAPAELHLQLRGRRLHKLSHAVLLAGGDHQVLGLGLLQHQPLRLHEIARMAPVALGAEVAEVEAVQQSPA
jgi:hypothetical protein